MAVAAVVTAGAGVYVHSLRVTHGFHLMLRVL